MRRVFEAGSFGFVDKLRPLIRPALALALGAATLVACGNDKDLELEITGECTSEEGVLRAEAANFTEGGRYTTEGRYPDGTEYTYIDNPGRVDQHGGLSDWSWECYLAPPNGPAGGPDCGDPPGRYEVLITDEATGRSVRDTFVIDAPEDYTDDCDYSPLT